jgi:hypothetical protein
MNPTTNFYASAIYLVIGVVLTVAVVGGAGMLTMFIRRHRAKHRY